jgi:hypothetical protein
MDWDKLWKKVLTIDSTRLFWMVYIAFLFVLWPQAAWTLDQFQDATTIKISLMGVQATPLAWTFSGVFETAIAIVTHMLNKHWEQMPRWRLVGISEDATREQRKAYNKKMRELAWKKFQFRWLNIFAVTLLMAMVISAVANYTHVVQFTNTSLKVFETSAWAVQIYQVLFGMMLPLVSFVFARVLSTVRESEQDVDPELMKANAELKEANATIRQLKREANEAEQQANATIRKLERSFDESEQRYRAVGDVVRFLFGGDMELRERIRGIRNSFPRLSQNGIAQIVGCSTSTVNEALVGYVVELPESVSIV